MLAFCFWGRYGGRPVMARHSSGRLPHCRSKAPERFPEGRPRKEANSCPLNSSQHLRTEVGLPLISYLELRLAAVESWVRIDAFEAHDSVNFHHAGISLSAR